MGIGGCNRLCLMANGEWIGYTVSLSVSIKDRPLLWMVVRSHTCLWEREGSLLSCRGFQLFLNRLSRGGDGGGLSTTLSLGLRSRGFESKFRREPRSLDRRVVDWSCLCLGYKRGVCFEVPNWDTLVCESPCDTVRLGYNLAP